MIDSDIGVTDLVDKMEDFIRAIVRQEEDMADGFLAQTEKFEAARLALILLLTPP